MKKYKFGLAICIIGLIIFLLLTTFETFKILSLDKSLLSEGVVTKCRANTSASELPYKCTITYTFKFDNQEYTCNKYTPSDTKKVESSNEVIYFSSKNPNKCFVGIKSLSVYTYAAIDFIFLISIISNMIIIKRGKELILK